MQRLQPLEKDSYLQDEFEDFRAASDSESSEDEVQVAMRQYLDGRSRGGAAGSKPGTRRQRTRIIEPTTTKQSTLDSNDFDAEMNSELDAAFSRHTGGLFGAQTSSVFGGAAHSAPQTQQHSSAASCSTDRLGKRKKQVKFDTNKKQHEGEGQSQQQDTEVDPALGLGDKGSHSDDEFADKEGMSQPSNDDLLYDPDEDDDNQRWVNEHRARIKSRADSLLLPDQSASSTDETTTNQKSDAGGRSDAILNCPACMTLLCSDCQRHSIYKTQYRAMFVENCTVNANEVLFMPSGPSRQARKKQEKLAGLKANERLNMETDDPQCETSSANNARPQDLFRPVVCAVCKTEVGVYDKDEVYHFFNVLSSYV